MPPGTFQVGGAPPRPVVCTASRQAVPAAKPSCRRLTARTKEVDKGQALNALAPAVLESPAWAGSNLGRLPQRLGEEDMRRELALLRGHARHLEEHVASLQHRREAMRAELQSAYSQLRMTAAERDAARAEASAAATRIASLQADLSATDRMDKADLWCSYARARKESLSLTDDLEACRGELRRTESALEQANFEKTKAARSANVTLDIAVALLAAV